MVIATKVYLPLNSVPASDPRRPNSYGLSRKHILEAVEGSLKRLETDYIDLYQVSEKPQQTFYVISNSIEDYVEPVPGTRKITRLKS